MTPDDASNDFALYLESLTNHLASDAHDLTKPVPEVPKPSQAALSAMSVPELAELCLRELDHYAHGEPSNEQFGLELFHRALMQRDSFAWEAAQQCFDAIMHRWLRGHALKEYACHLDSEENYVAQGFARFWQATVDNPAIAFHSLGAASKYLRACLHAVIIDTLRANSRARVVGLPEPGDPGEPLHEDHYDSGELWQTITHLLPDKRQLRVAYLLYQCGLKPREIVRFCFDEFDDVQEIYHIRRAIIERLRRNGDILRWQLGDKIVGD